jgi:hypothetical protein
MWAGLALSAIAPRIPPSFAILAVAAGGYAIVLAASTLRQRRTSAA